MPMSTYEALRTKNNHVWANTANHENSDSDTNNSDNSKIYDNDSNNDGGDDKRDNYTWGGW